eukprot:scaffold54486_cov31-Tisochrysis_lutea.AAC.2
MDGVRLTQPTILLSAEKGSSRGVGGSTHLPLGVVLALAGSGGKRLACAVGSGLDELGLGISLADLLLPKPALCGRCLDLTIGEHRLIGHPLPIHRAPDAPSELRALNVAFVLDAWPAAEMAKQYTRSLSVCRIIAAELGETLAHHEALSSLVSTCVSTSAVSPVYDAPLPTSLSPKCGTGMGTAAAVSAVGCEARAEPRREQPRAEREGGRPTTPGRAEASARSSADTRASTGMGGWLPPGSAGTSAGPPPPLSIPLAAALDAVSLGVDYGHTVVRVPLPAQLVLDVQLPPPPSERQEDSPMHLARVPGAMPPPPGLRPYLGLLPLRDDTLSSIPPDGSQLLDRLVREASPLRSFSELHLETGLPMSTLFKLALHLEKWGHMRIITPITEDSIFCVHPNASTAPDCEAACAYAAAFGSRPALPYVSALQLFSTPRRFGALLRSQRVPARRLVQTTILLWRKRAIQQLALTVACVEDPPEPAPQPCSQVVASSGSGADAHVVEGGRSTTSPELARWRLFQQLRPMLHGDHSIEEIAWHEGIPRKAIEEIVGAYPEHLVTLAIPADGEE